MQHTYSLHNSAIKSLNRFFFGLFQLHPFVQPVQDDYWDFLLIPLLGLAIKLAESLGKCYFRRLKVLGNLDFLGSLFQVGILLQNNLYLLEDVFVFQFT